MNNFLFSLNATVPVFAVIVLGHFFKRIGLIDESKLKEILHKNEAEKQKNAVVWVLAIIGAIAGIAAIAYAVFRFVTPDYLEDFEDDFDDDFDDYFDEDDQV